MTNEPDPQWVREAARAIRHEVAAFLATLWLITVSPARFAAEWSSGQRTALNPFAFMLNSIAVLGPWHVLWARIVNPNPPDVPILVELAVLPLLPILKKLALAALIHVSAWLFGGRRPLRSSMAIAIYVVTGPLGVLSFLSTPVVAYTAYHPQSSIMAAWGLVGLATFMPIFVIYIAVAEGGLHGLSRRRMVMATLLALTLFVLLLSAISAAAPQLGAWMRG